MRYLGLNPTHLGGHYTLSRRAFQKLEGADNEAILPRMETLCLRMIATLLK